MNALKRRGYISLMMSYPQQTKIIRRYCCNRNQIGGAFKQIQYGDYTFHVDISKDKDGITANVVVPDENNPRECVMIIIDAENKLAIIQGISTIAECTVPAFVGSGHGSLLLKFSLSFLREYKRKFKINRIVLQDNSLKTCQHCNDRIRMADLHFLVNADTWYGKHGFRPYDSVDNKPDVNDLMIYNRNKRIIDKAITSDVPLYEMIKDAVHKLKITNVNLKKIKKFVELNKDHKLSRVIGLFYDNYDMYCCIFTIVARQIMDSLGMISFYGKTFYLDI